MRSRRMGNAATIVLARADLSIPGAPEGAVSSADHADARHSRFFDLVSDSRPDVIVLDLRGAARSGVDTILTVSRRSAVPILVVCDLGQPTKEYRTAGAADCISGPVDILRLYQSIKRIVGPTGSAGGLVNRAAAMRGVQRTSRQGQHNTTATAARPS
jgi:DNA-binding response OmpR family regulator